MQRRRGAVAHVERARLTMRRFSDAFLDDYLAAMGERRAAPRSAAMRSKAWARSSSTRIEGDYFAILGLPLLPLLGFLRERGALAR